MPDHGTLSGYLHLPCHDEPACPAAPSCSGVHRANQKRYRALRPGRHPDPSTKLTVDAEPSRRHIAMLRSQGVGWVTIERLTKIENRTLRAIANGRKRVYPATEAKILSVHVYSARGSTLVPAKRFRRLVRELQREMGWTRRRIMAEAGLSHGVGYGEWVSARAAHAVYALAFRHLPEPPGNPW